MFTSLKPLGKLPPGEAASAWLGGRMGTWTCCTAGGWMQHRAQLPSLGYHTQLSGTSIVQCSTRFRVLDSAGRVSVESHDRSGNLQRRPFNRPPHLQQSSCLL